MGIFLHEITPSLILTFHKKKRKVSTSKSSILGIASLHEQIASLHEQIASLHEQIASFHEHITHFNSNTSITNLYSFSEA